MKNTFVILTIAFLVVQQASSRPDTAQEMMDRVKAKAQEALESAQESASKAIERAQEVAARAVESAKSAAHDAMEASEHARQQGIAKGQELLEYGKSVAASWSNQTVTEKPEQMSE